MPVITFENVTKTYPGQKRPALHDVSTTIEDGEFVFLVGPSGSGKSTFLRLVLREYRASSGKVLVNGRDVGRLRSWGIPKLRRGVGIVFQDFRLLPGKTVTENVAFTLQVIGRPSREIRRLVPETLELVGLADKGDRLPEELSGGEQQRVAIARAFVNRPGILLADEPTGKGGLCRSRDLVPSPAWPASTPSRPHPHPPRRHHGGDGDPRRHHRRPDASPRPRTQRRRTRPRPGPRRLRIPVSRSGSGEHTCVTH